MSETDIAKRFPAMSLEDTLKKEEQEPSKRLNNKKKRKNQDSEMEDRVEFKGVSWWRGVYVATLSKASDDIRWLGRYKSPETAAMVHDVAAYRIFGADYDAFNFPQDIRRVMNLTRISTSKSLKQEKEQAPMVEDGVEFIGVSMSGDMYAATLSDASDGILSLGSYKSPETAAMVHDVAAYMIFGADHDAFNFLGSISLVMKS